MSDVDDELAALGRTLRAATVRVVDERGRGAGSGVIWRADGTIVTNAHVVRGRSAGITFEDGRNTRARVVRRDDDRDLAELRVSALGETAPAVIRASQSLVAGELVVACGNPLGLVGALSAGLVQRRNARWVVADVRLAPGNSGGPLADSAGRIVGINSMVAGGLALAVPSDAVTAFLGDAVTTPRRLGIACVPAVARIAGRRIPALVVTELDDAGVAARVGLALGDAIVATERGAPRDPQALVAALATAKTLDVVRAGRPLRVVLPGGEDARAA